jgi:peptidoglycan hydrolase-like protein with peptidoglycan-binding domain
MASYLSRGLWGALVILALVQPSWAANTEAPPPKTAAAEKHLVRSSGEVKKLQEALKAKGDDPGAIDGVMGRKTVAALKRFQADNGLKATGKLDKVAAEKLGIEMAGSGA